MILKYADTFIYNKSFLKYLINYYTSLSLIIAKYLNIQLTLLEKNRIYYKQYLHHVEI